jgi:integrase
MASIHKQPGKPFWFASYSTRDPETGTLRRHFKSTGTANKKQAEAIARTWQLTAETARADVLNADRARDIVARGVSDIMLATTKTPMPTSTTKAWIDRWLEDRELAASPGTFTRYKGIAKRFADFLGTKANRNMAALTVDDMARFRDHEARERSIATANLSLKVARMILAEACRRGLLTSNPAAAVKILKRTGDRAHRRPFTLDELHRLLAQAGDSEWRGLILFGIYTGQRLGDLARLTWQQVDVAKRVVRFVQQKTGHRLELPLAAPLADYLLSLPASDDPKAFVFPKSAALTETTTLSNQFRGLLEQAGLIQTATEAKTKSGRAVHQKTKKGRSAKRELNAISFHSLRHSAVSLLKATGATDAMARAIAGHESAAISQHYTHLTADDLRGAVDALPDITAKESNP